MFNLNLIPKKKPYARNFLDEAYQIAKGNRRISPKVEHIQAALGQTAILVDKIGKLQGMMKLLYREACERRRAAGLPLPPPPPGLE